MDEGLGQFLFVVAGAFSVLVTIIWLVIGWRAMRAHQRIAASLDEIRHAIRTYFKSQ